MQGGGKNLHDILINLDVAIKISVRSNRLKVVALVKWLVEKDFERVVEEKRCCTCTA